MKITGLNALGFEASGEGRNLFRAVNPSTQEPLNEEFHEADANEIGRAVEKAERAFLEYRKRPGKEKALFLEQIAEEIENTGDELIVRCHEETALPAARLTGERGRTVNQLRLFAAVIRDGSWVDARIDPAIPDRKPAPRPDIRQMQIALGPVGIFGASNFPLAFSVAGGDTASALAAGCSVVVKAHPLHPGTSELVGHCINKAARRMNMPDGVFSLIQGRSNDSGMAIVKHPGIKAIGFTGSYKGGKAIFDAANEREIPIPVFAEMGSVNPVFILPGAMKERNGIIARSLFESFNLGVGQFCTSPGLFFTDSSAESDRMLVQMKTMASELTPGTMLSERILENYISGVKKFTGIKEVREITAIPMIKDGNKATARIFTTDGETFMKNQGLSEEVFGPSIVNIKTRNKQELLDIAEQMEGHLTATIHGTEQDLKEYGELIAILERKAGRLIFNGFPTGVEVCHAMVHGGPFPSTTSSQHTSVGTAAIIRFSRPVCYQDFPQTVLPDELKNNNPLNIWRMVNGEMARDNIG